MSFKRLMAGALLLATLGAGVALGSARHGTDQIPTKAMLASDHMIADTADGQGYWLVASDSGVSTYGMRIFMDLWLARS
jgi:hypothetical protein